MKLQVQVVKSDHPETEEIFIQRADLIPLSTQMVNCVHLSMWLPNCYHKHNLKSTHACALKREAGHSVQSAIKTKRPARVCANACGPLRITWICWGKRGKSDNIPSRLIPPLNQRENISPSNPGPGSCPKNGALQELLETQEASSYRIDVPQSTAKKCAQSPSFSRSHRNENEKNDVPNQIDFQGPPSSFKA